MKFKSDIDIDFAERQDILKYITVTPAVIKSGNSIKKHNTGVYPTEIPVNPLTGHSSLDYIEAEERGYVKLDLLNVWVYKLVKDEAHLLELMREPVWVKLLDRDFFSKLIHIGKHFNTMTAMPEPVDSIPRLAMFLNLIRPGRRHLIGKPWCEVAEQIWTPDADGLYAFKKSHAVAYAHLVVVNMNLLDSKASA